MPHSMLYYALQSAQTKTMTEEMKTSDWMIIGSVISYHYKVMSY